MGRRLNTKIPTHADLLKPQTIHSETVKQKLNEKQAVQQKYYDRGTRSLSPLKPGDTVRVWNPEKKKWNPAIVESLTNKPRSYIVVTQEGSKLRRNRQDILKSDEVSFNPDLVNDQIHMDDYYDQNPTQPETNEPMNKMIKINPKA